MLSTCTLLQYGHGDPLLHTRDVKPAEKQKKLVNMLLSYKTLYPQVNSGGSLSKSVLRTQFRVREPAMHSPWEYLHCLSASLKPSHKLRSVWLVAQSRNCLTSKWQGPGWAGAGRGGSWNETRKLKTYICSTRWSSHLPASRGGCINIWHLLKVPFEIVFLKNIVHSFHH